MSIGQYIRDTQAEMRHVAWPTRTQTIVYTLLVLIISLLVALYLGFFDYLFTTGLREIINALPSTYVAPAAPTIEISTTTVQ